MIDDDDDDDDDDDGGGDGDDGDDHNEDVSDDEYDNHNKCNEKFEMKSMQAKTRPGTHTRSPATGRSVNPILELVCVIRVRWARLCGH